MLVVCELRLHKVKTPDTQVQLMTSNNTFIHKSQPHRTKKNLFSYGFTIIDHPHNPNVGPIFTTWQASVIRSTKKGKGRPAIINDGNKLAG